MALIEFKNKPDTTTSINATNLNNNFSELNDKIENVEVTDIYSMSEVKTNKIWIDNKPIYRKIIDVGNLPNNDYKAIEHNIQNMDELVNVSAIAVSSGGYYFNIPFVGTPSIFSSTQIAIRANPVNIQIASTTDASTYTAYAILEYTKTTD